jgi:nucleoside-diphosphate-sugar epimerase
MNKAVIAKSNGLSHVLITGATGAVGPSVVQAFYAKGYLVRTLSIDPPPRGLWPDDVEVLIGDVTDRATVEAAMKGVDFVVHLAALLHIVNPHPELQKDYERINVGGTTTVVESALKGDIKRLVFLSTISVYGPSEGAILTEDSPTRPLTFYAQSKSAAESIVISARRADGAALGTVLRLGAVYGARIKGNYKRLVHALNRGRFILPGSGLNRRTLIYDKDVSRAILLATEHDMAAGRIFNVTDGQFHTVNDITLAIRHALGRNYPTLYLPTRPVRWIVAFTEKFFGFIGLHPPITHEAINTFLEDIAVDGRRFHDMLGFYPRYNLQKGWKDAVSEMRKSGDL